MKTLAATLFVFLDRNQLSRAAQDLILRLLTSTKLIFSLKGGKHKDKIAYATFLNFMYPYNVDTIKANFEF